MVFSFFRRRRLMPTIGSRSLESATLLTRPCVYSNYLALISSVGGLQEGNTVSLRVDELSL